MVLGTPMEVMGWILAAVLSAAIAWQRSGLIRQWKHLKRIAAAYLEQKT
jgi:hypothetical protein